MRNNSKPKQRITRKGKFVFSFLLLLLCILLFGCIYFLSHHDNHTDEGADRGGNSIATSKQENLPNQNNPKESVPKEPILPPSDKVSVYFNIKSTDLNSANQSDLNKIIDLSKEFPDAAIVVEGNAATNYPDDPSKYNASENFEISMQRAEQVKSYLVSQGIAPQLISTVSNGSAKPINDNATTSQRSKNRRADVFFK